jgi:D-methionine transport system ATP-binding protein
VLITHELDVVKSICDHAASMAGGRLVEAGPVPRLLADPQSLLGASLRPTCGLPLGHAAPGLSFLKQYGVRAAQS